MSILIKGMKMPKACGFCHLYHRFGAIQGCPFCQVDIYKYGLKRHEDCPLVEVKEPHGRLIDADAFERRCMFDSEIEDMQDMIYALRDYPAVIESEDE